MVGTIPRRRLSLVMVAATVLSLAGPLADERASAITDEGLQMKRLINRTREAHGRRKLRLSDTLTRVAQRHTREMASKNRLYHNPDLAHELRYYSWSILGENVGVGATVRSLHRAFMNSYGHRANILRRSFRRVGVGTVRANGRLWVTVVFSG